jgi:O-antigen ligase
MKALRFGIGAAVTFAVLAHGAVEVWSESLLVLLAGVLLLVWCALAAARRLEIAWNPLLAPVSVLAAMGAAQWLFGWTAYAHATRVETLKLAALGVFLFLFVQCFRSAEELRPFVWFLLLLGFAVSLFGILQHLTFNGKLYWVRELTGGGVPFGPYVNRNHFAGLMELLAPMGLALLLHRGVPRDQLPLAALFTAFPVAGLLLSASRGGIVSFLFQVLLLGILSVWRPVGKKAVAWGLVVALFTGALVFWLGIVPTWERLLQTDRSEVTHGRRMSIVTDSLRIARDHPWFGTGLGTFEHVFPRYETAYDGKVVDHAHCDYVEVLVETGLAGALGGAAFLFLLFRLALLRWSQAANSFSAAARLGALVGCAGLLLHGLVDFNLRIPSNALLFLLLAGVATLSSRTAQVLAVPNRHS